MSITSQLTPYGWLAMLAVLSLTIYTALLLGWSANSSYSLVGSLRSSSALISYELILATSALITIVAAQSYSPVDILLTQSIVCYAELMPPVWILFLISVLAETSRVPFDLVEAESELVSGYMTEHASVAFVLLFLTEYASILLFSVITGVLWLGAVGLVRLLASVLLVLAIIILMRAVLPRIRYDQLIDACWKHLLPLLFGAIVLLPAMRYLVH